MQRLLPLAVLLSSSTSVLWMLWSPEGLARLTALERERTALNDEVGRVSREIARLRHEVQHIKTAPSSVERVARDELGLVRQSEFVVQFSNDSLKPLAPADAHRR
jgi:cell division protein FtsB